MPRNAQACLVLPMCISYGNPDFQLLVNFVFEIHASTWWIAEDLVFYFYDWLAQKQSYIGTRAVFSRSISKVGKSVDGEFFIYSESDSILL